MKIAVSGIFINESQSEKNEYILSIKCPVCGHEVVYLPFPRSLDEEPDELVESPCQHTIYLNNFHEGIYSHQSKHELLKDWVMANMEEEGEDEEVIEETHEDELFDEDGCFKYDMYLGDETAESLCNFLSKAHPQAQFYFTDTCKELGVAGCGATIADSIAFKGE
ncbi:MAG: hypothetical protein RSE35_11320 [Bacteroidales bacterium]